ncbi:PqiB family protein [Acidimangrovimonas sediminis]|uniref:PqiB family protein n=1 Tax=Acidimangrovimonas sediminis TaxID=2056283 RepID=UPI000C7FBB05|nr:MlaD family protein [Acidimangrovimonas sediminis]
MTDDKTPEDRPQASDETGNQTGRNAGNQTGQAPGHEAAGDAGAGTGTGTGGRPAEMDVSAPRGIVRRNLSVVWLVPVIALIVSLTVAWRAYNDRGALIHITFASGDGIQAGQSVLKYRDVPVGKVEKVGFTPDLKKVEVSVRVDKSVADHIGKNAQFWVVRPEIGLSGITGLNTVLSGVYIEGQWDPKTSGPTPSHFTGLEKAPVAGGPDSGTWVTIEAPDGGALIEGAPILMRGLKVGEIQNIRLAPSGDGVLVDAFVKAPYNKRLTTSSVFWNASGFSVSLGASGVKLSVRSLSSLIQGGIEFDTFVSGGRPVTKDNKPTYQLFPDEPTARDSIFSDTGAPKVKLSILLGQSVRGLKVGDNVNFRGLKVGEVSNLAINVTDAPNGGRIVQQRIDFTLIPERMGLARDADKQDLMDFLASQVREGLRAQVTSTGILGGTLEVDLLDMPSAKPATIDTGAKPFPVMPSVEPHIPDVSASAEGVLARINALPIEQLMDSAISLLNNTNKLIGQSDTQKVPGEVAGLVSDIRKVVAAPGIQHAPENVNKVLTSIDQFFAALEKAKTVDAIVSAMNDASAAAQAVSDSAKGVPKLVDTYTALGDKVNKLPLDSVVDNANKLIASVNVLTSAEQTKKLPQSLNEALASLNGMLTDLQNGGATQKLNDTLASADSAAQSVKAASDQLPALVKRLDAVVAQADNTISAYGSRSNFNSETLATLRQLRDAASQISAVARMLQRNPQALILGR